jgi:hypothetical protein
VILDAGGGTVDAVTYEVTSSDPLRLSAEVVPPRSALRFDLQSDHRLQVSAKLCGASYINERFTSFLMNKLNNESYLEKNGKTIRSIVDRKVIEFENTTKRIWDLNNPHCVVAPIWIDDLQPSQTDDQLQQNRVNIKA